jgi:flagellar FliL protein|tara:strand:- start:8116 stop:8640 length:525 start_codon:yes stop_codon:yes gene_type:complete
MNSREKDEGDIMTAIADMDETAPPKKSKLPLIAGLVLAIAGGGGGFFAVKSGIIGGSSDPDAVKEASDESAEPFAQIAFVALDPLVISLPDQGSRALLRFAAQLEVAPEYAAEVEAVKPRIIDVLNGYLRAVEIAELEDPTALMRLRGQMLRRVQIVTGEGRVRDLLIMEFVIN